VKSSLLCLSVSSSVEAKKGGLFRLTILANTVVELELVKRFGEGCNLGFGTFKYTSTLVVGVFFVTALIGLTVFSLVAFVFYLGLSRELLIRFLRLCPS